MYCGDGVNDLAALAAADVGMAVGSSDALVAASVITKQQGIAGGASLSHSPLSVTDCLMLCLSGLEPFRNQKAPECAGLLNKWDCTSPLHQGVP